MSLFFNENQSNIRETILEYIPKEAEISRIEFEGPRIAIYTKKPDILIEKNYIVSDIVNIIRKRVVVRSDPSVRLPETDVRKIIAEKIPQEAEITDIFFDQIVGETIIEAKKPGLVIGKNGNFTQEMLKSTKWRMKVLRTPPMHSKIIANIRHYSHSKNLERERILRNVGERIFRPTIFQSDTVRLTSFGGFQEVGRSAILIQTKESNVLLDCGIKPGSDNTNESFPRFDINEFSLELLDAVVISHAHLDHCGFLPFLYKYGYDGPVYCSEPTASLMTLLQLDYLDVARSRGVVSPYDQKDIRETVLHTISIGEGIVTDIAPDMRLTLYNAGHILGSSMIHIHIGKGLYNLLYTGDFKNANTLLLGSATTNFPRVETLIMESTYGAPDDIMPNRKTAEEQLISIINSAIRKGGKVLIPVPAVGRAQEIMLVIDKYIRSGLLEKIPVYLEGMIKEATSIHTAYPEYLAIGIREAIFRDGINPFQPDYFVHVKDSSSREKVMVGEPCIILATSGMLEGGSSIDYFKNFAHDEKNTLIFVTYQIDGTLGQRIQKGIKEVSLVNHEDKMEVIKINMKIETIDGFSGHSDRNQLLSYLRRITPRPEKIIINHGEKKKCISLMNIIQKMYNINSYSPEVTESVKLK